MYFSLRRSRIGINSAKLPIVEGKRLATISFLNMENLHLATHEGTEAELQSHCESIRPRNAPNMRECYRLVFLL